MEAKFEELIEGFITNKIGISETFLSLSLSSGLQQNIHKLNRDSRMERAGVGNGAGKDKIQKIRGDKTSWIDSKSKNNDELEFLDIIGRFMGHLNDTCYTGLNAFEFHYAVYEEGTAYGRHKDQFRSDQNRKFSMISYLNEGWTEDDGGQLIIHHEDSAQQIMPNNQKTVFFRSDVIEHEVALAQKQRMSVAGWLKRV